MIQPISIANSNVNFRNSSNITMTKTSSAPVSAEKSDLMLYLEKKDAAEKREKEASLALMGISLAAIGGMLVFNLKKANKHGVSNLSTKFESLQSYDNIPTLENCKSINPDLKEFLENQVTYAKAAKEDLLKAGSPEAAKSLFLYGPTGSGKSFFAKIFAKTLGAEYMDMSYADINSQWAGASVEKMTKIFKDVLAKASKNPDKKYVLTINEADTLIQPIDKLNPAAGGHSLSKIEERSTFLVYLEKIQQEAPNVTTILTTNVAPKNNGLDGASMSRIKSNMIKVEYPEQKCLYEALKEHIRTIGGGEDFIANNDKELDKFADALHKRGASYRDLNNIMDTSKNYYLKDVIKDKNSVYKFDYLKRALSSVSVTDGELSGAA